MKRMKTLIVTAIIAALVLTAAMSSCTTVSEGSVGVKYRFGTIVDDGMEAGLHFKVPFLDSIKKVDVREQIYETAATAYTKDTQTVENLQVKLNYQYDRSQLSDIIRTIGIGNVEAKLIVPQVNSVLKNAVGKFKAEELVQNRSALQEMVEAELRESLAGNGITVTALNIENIDFEDSFEEVIRQKVAAEQEALRIQNETVAKEEQAKQLVIAAQAEAEAQRIKAEAEAYAIELIQKELSASPEYVKLQMVERWNGQYPQVMGDTVNPFTIIDNTGDVVG